MNLSKSIAPGVWRPYIWALIVSFFSAIVFCIIYWEARFDLGGLYSQKLRSELFSGLLAVGAFLLAVKTFILIELKKGVYESKPYLDRYKKGVEQGLAQKLHKPFTNLGRFLVNSVFVLLAAACVHITIGLIDSPVAYIFSLSITVGGLMLLFFAWWYLKANLRVWFDLLDERDLTE